MLCQQDEQSNVEVIQIRKTSSCVYSKSWRASLLAIRIRSPYLYSRIGMGTNAQARSASRVLAQPTPRLRYVAPAKSGNPAPNMERMKSFPASTLAAYVGYASAR